METDCANPANPDSTTCAGWSVRYLHSVEKGQMRLVLDLQRSPIPDTLFSPSFRYRRDYPLIILQSPNPINRKAKIHNPILRVNNLNAGSVFTSPASQPINIE